MPDPSASPDAAAALDHRDLLRAVALEAALARHRVPVASRQALLVSDRPELFRERLEGRGAQITVRSPGVLAPAAPAPATVPAVGEGRTFDLVLWLDFGFDPTIDAAWDSALTWLADGVGPGGWFGLVAATPERGPAAPGDPPTRPWADWETALLARGLALHDVRAARRFSGPGARVPMWLRPFPGLAWRIDQGLIATGLLWAGPGPQMVLARRPPGGRRA